MYISQGEGCSRELAGRPAPPRTLFDRGGRFIAQVASSALAQRGYQSTREFTEVRELQRKQILCRGEKNGRAGREADWKAESPSCGPDINLAEVL